jgi:hypothetical protein
LKPKASETFRSSNSKIGNALANLIKMHGKKNKDITSQGDTSSLTGSSITKKSKNLAMFESAFKQRLAKTKIGNKSANEIFIAAMEAEYKAK